MSQVTLEEVFSDEVAEEISEPEVEVETVEVEAAPEDSTTESEPEETVAEQPKAEPDDDPKKWTFQMAMDEREKRQKAVREAEELRERIKALEATKEPDVDIFEDQEGWKAQQEKRNQALLTDALLNQSEALAVREFGQEKVTEAVEWFKETAPKSPYLLERFNKTALKHHEIIDMFNEERERQSMSDLPAYKARLKAEILAELKAQTEGKVKPESITPSLAGKRSAATEGVSADDLNVIPLDR